MLYLERLLLDSNTSLKIDLPHINVHQQGGTSPNPIKKKQEISKTPINPLRGIKWFLGKITIPDVPPPS